MKKYLNAYLVLFGSGALIILLDQISKQLVRTNLAIGETWVPWEWLLPYARIIHWQNTGAAFGMLQGFNLIFTILALVVSTVIIYYFPRVPANDWTLRTALCMQMGGALGNVVDRLTQGYVTDFVSLGNFAVFNVADASISIGVAVLILGVWLSERKHKRAQSGKSTEQGETEEREGE